MRYAKPSRLVLDCPTKYGPFKDVSKDLVDWSSKGSFPLANLERKGIVERNTATPKVHDTMDKNVIRRILLCALFLALVVFNTTTAAVVGSDVTTTRDTTTSAGDNSMVNWLKKDPISTNSDEAAGAVSAIIYILILVGCCGGAFLIIVAIIFLTVLIGRGQIRRAESLGIKSEEVITTLLLWFFLRNLGVHRLYWGMFFCHLTFCLPRN